MRTLLGSVSCVISIYLGTKPVTLLTLQCLLCARHLRKTLSSELPHFPRGGKLFLAIFFFKEETEIRQLTSGRSGTQNKFSTLTKILFWSLSFNLTNGHSMTYISFVPREVWYDLHVQGAS